MRPTRPGSPGAAAVRCALGVGLVWLALPIPGAGADPRTDYMLHCRGCHGPSGEGTPGVVPPVRGEVGAFLAVPGGREFLIRVPGTAQSELSDGRVAALLNWMLREFSAEHLPADFVPFTEAEVSRHRRPPLTDVEAVRRELVRAIAGRR